MNKRQCELIEAIVAINKSAGEQFLSRFTEADLEKYLLSLQSLVEIPITGDWHRYGKYFHDGESSACQQVQQAAVSTMESSAEIDDVSEIPTALPVMFAQVRRVEEDDSAGAAQVEQEYDQQYRHVESVVADRAYCSDVVDEDDAIATVEIIEDNSDDCNISFHHGLVQQEAVAVENAEEQTEEHAEEQSHQLVGSAVGGQASESEPSDDNEESWLL